MEITSEKLYSLIEKKMTKNKKKMSKIIIIIKH